MMSVCVVYKYIFAYRLDQSRGSLFDKRLSNGVGTRDEHGKVQQNKTSQNGRTQKRERNIPSPEHRRIGRRPAEQTSANHSKTTKWSKEAQGKDEHRTAEYRLS